MCECIISTPDFTHYSASPNFMSKSPTNCLGQESLVTHIHHVCESNGKSSTWPVDPIHIPQFLGGNNWNRGWTLDGLSWKCTLMLQKYSLSTCLIRVTKLLKLHWRESIDVGMFVLQIQTNRILGKSYECLH
jgi:hypothetical protein